MAGITVIRPRYVRPVVSGRSLPTRGRREERGGQTVGEEGKKGNMPPLWQDSDPWGTLLKGSWGRVTAHANTSLGKHGSCTSTYFTVHYHNQYTHLNTVGEQVNGIKSKLL